MTTHAQSVLLLNFGEGIPELHTLSNPHQDELAESPF